MPNPIDNPELYKSIVLAGVSSPGQVTLSGHDRKTAWDVKTAPQTKGATTTLKEIPPIEFTCTFYLVKDPTQNVDDFADWPAFQSLIESTVSGTKPKALDIYHPDLASNEIKSVVKALVGGVVHDGKGGQTIVVKFQEYVPPKPKSGSVSGSATKPKADPNAAAKAELAAALAAYQATPWG